MIRHMHRTDTLRAIVAAILLATGAAVYAEPVKRTMPACTSEASLDELTTYSAKGDKDGISQLFADGSCILLRAGDNVSVISPGFLVATVRYKGQKLYTPSEALR